MLEPLIVEVAAHWLSSIKFEGCWVSTIFVVLACATRVRFLILVAQSLLTRRRGGAEVRRGGDLRTRPDRWLAAFLCEELVGYVAVDGNGGHFGGLNLEPVPSAEYRHRRASTIIRSWKGTLDDDFGPWVGKVHGLAATAASVFIHDRP